MALLRVGLVGLGDVGAHHARALVALHGRELTFAAVCAREPARIERFRAERSVPADVVSFASLDAMLASGACDAAILATPDGLHADQAIACAEHGVHVLVEKPLALTHADGARVVARCAERGTVLEVGYQLRHHAGHAVVRARLDELVGPLRHVDVRWAWPDPAITGWRARGEGARFWSLAALGTHGIDLAIWMADARVVEARGVRTPADGVDRAADVSLRFANDVLAHVSCAVTHRAISRVVLTGDRGELECLGTLGARGEGSIAVRPLREAPRAIDFEPVDPYLAQLRAFVSRARTPGTTDVLSNLAVLDALATNDPMLPEMR